MTVKCGLVFLEDGTRNAPLSFFCHFSYWFYIFCRSFYPIVAPARFFVHVEIQFSRDGYFLKVSLNVRASLMPTKLHDSYMIRWKVADVRQEKFHTVYLGKMVKLLNGFKRIRFLKKCRDSCRVPLTRLTGVSFAESRLDLCYFRDFVKWPRWDCGGKCLFGISTSHIKWFTVACFIYTKFCTFWRCNELKILFSQ